MLRKASLLAGIACFSASFALAQERAAGITEGMTKEVSAAGSGIAFGGGQDFQASANLGYNHLFPNVLDKNIQGSVNFDLNLTENVTNFTILVGPTFNYMRGDTLSNAYFGTFQVGIGYQDTDIGAFSQSETDFAYQVGLGKRFEVNRYVSWKPSFNIGKGGSFSPTETSFNIVPLQFSFFWD